MIKTFEQTIEIKINEAKLLTQEKLFKEFVNCTNDDERREIGVQMDVLSKVIYNFNIIMRKAERV